MKTITTLLLISFSLLVFGQNNYRVLKIEGCLKTELSTNCIEGGTFLAGNEIIKFDKPNSFAVLMNSTGELVTLRPTDTAGYSQGKELMFSFTNVAKSLTIPKEGESTRGTASQTVTNFTDFFGTLRFTIIGDEVRFGISPRLYPVSKDKFLVIHYNLDTSKVSKRLGFREQVVRIQKDRINEYNGNNFDKNKIEGVSLYYYQPSTKFTERLATFDLVFINADQLYSDFDAVYKTLPDKEKKSPQELVAIFEAFFTSFYGKTEPQSLKFTISSPVLW